MRATTATTARRPSFSPTMWSLSLAQVKKTFCNIAEWNDWSRWRSRASTRRCSATARQEVERHSRWLDRLTWWVKSDFGSIKCVWLSHEDVLQIEYYMCILFLLCLLQLQFMGTPNMQHKDHGLIFRSFIYLFHLLQQRQAQEKTQFVLKASFLEIYNEKVRAVSLNIPTHFYYISVGAIMLYIFWGKHTKQIEIRWML